MTAAAPRRRRGLADFTIFAGVVVILVLLAAWAAGWDKVFSARVDPETEDAYAAGETRPVSTRVEGYLRRLLVTDFQNVRAGQPLAELEDDDYRARVAQAEAQLQAARAQFAQLDGQEQVLRLRVAQAADQQAGIAAQQRRAAEEAARQAALLPTALGLRRNYDNAAARSGQLAAQARAQAAQATEAERQIGVVEAEKASARAMVDVRQAALDLARIELGYTVIRAPADGTLGNRQVRQGTLLETGTSIAPLTPLDHVWVVANFSERQLTYIHPGQEARVRFDTFPDVTLHAHVAGISPLTGSQLSDTPADNTTGNYTKVIQRVPVKIVIDVAETRLRGQIRPGMSALARVLTRGAPGVRTAR